MPDVVPLQVTCPTWGRDSDGDDAEFQLRTSVRFPGSEDLLADMTCVACHRRLELVLWPVDTAACLR